VQYFWFFYQFKFIAEDSVIIAAQFYALDRQKFIEKISKIKKETMEKIENGMMLVLGINR
jgi:hypothetical protein